MDKPCFLNSDEKQCIFKDVDILEREKCYYKGEQLQEILYLLYILYFEESNFVFNNFNGLFKIKI